MINEVIIVLDYCKTVKIDSLSISEIQANSTEVITRLQYQDPKWHRIRQDHINQLCSIHSERGLTFVLRTYGIQPGVNPVTHLIGPR